MEVEIDQNFEQIAIVSDEDIKAAFSEFNMDVDDTLIADFKRLCIVYNIDAEELVSQWISFTAQANCEQAPTAEKFEKFEREFVHRKAICTQTEILDGPKKKIRSSLTYSTDLSILRDYGDESIAEEPKVDKPTETIKKIEKVQNLSSQCVQELKKHIIQYYGDSLSPEKWLNLNGNTCKLSPYDSSSYLDKPYKYMRLNIHNCSEVMDQTMQNVAESFYSNLDMESVGDLDVDSSEATGALYFVGRVRVEIREGKQPDKSLILEGTQNSRRRAKLDLSELTDYSLFPGQIIAVKATYDFNNGLKVSQIVDMSSTIKPFSAKIIDIKHPLFIVFATGPYCSMNEVNETVLRKILNYVKESKPQFLVLAGPFVDCENSVIKDNRNPHELFNDLMNTINQQLQNTNTTAVIIPSTRDLHHDFIYPTPPFQRDSENQWPNIYFAPNPSLLDISGVVIAVNSADILMHLIRTEIARNSGENEGKFRLMRLCKHILLQQSFYPLSPADTQINLQYTKMKHLSLPVTPHLFLMTSQLKSFAKKTNGCVFVNNESATKGIMSRIRIEPLVDSQGAIDKHIDVELIKF